MGARKELPHTRPSILLLDFGLFHLLESMINQSGYLLVVAGLSCLVESLWTMSLSIIDQVVVGARPVLDCD